MPHYLFDNKLKIIKIISNKEVKASDQDYELGALIQHTIEIPYSKEADACVYFGMNDPLEAPEAYATEASPFWIYRVGTRRKGEDGSYISLTGVHKFFDDLKAKAFIKDIRPQNTEFKNVIPRILQGTGWTAKVGPSLSGYLSSSSYYMCSPLTAFWEAVSRWKAEFTPVIYAKEGKIVDQLVQFERRIGSDKGRTYVYGDKLVKTVAETVTDDFYTAYIGLGAGDKVSESEESGQAGYGRKITFEDVSWDKEKSSRSYPVKEELEVDDQHDKKFQWGRESDSKKPPVSKAQGTIYVEDKEATALYGYPDGSPRIGFFEDSECEDPNALLEETWEHLSENSRPKVQLKTTVFDTEPVQVGEIVRVRRDDLNLKYKTRVFRVKRNFLNPKVQEIEFGDILVESVGRKTINQRVAHRKEEETELEELKDYIINAQGDRLNFGDQPKVAHIGDLWFETQPDGTQYIKYWDGKNWIELVSTKTQEEIEAGVGRAEKKAEEKYQEILDDFPDLVDGAFEKKTPEEVTSLIKKGDFLSIINQQSGSIIFGAEDASGKNLLQITPETTYIQNGTIKNAMIASLDAGKIKSGTIDASKIRVINLDASNIATGSINARKIEVYNLDADNITAGKIDGDRIRANQINVNDLAGNRFEFVQGAISDGTSALNLFPDSVYLGDVSGYGFYTKLSSSGMDFIYDGHYTGTITTSTTSGGDASGVMFYARPGNTLYIGSKYGSTYFRNLIVDRYNTTLRGRIRIEDENSRLAFDLRTTSYTYPWRVYVDSDFQNHRICDANLVNSSDPRLKKNIKKWDKSGIKELGKIKFRTFKWRNPERGEGKQYGVIAEEGNFISTRDIDGYLYISKDNLLYLTGKATQELAEENNKLKEKVESLEKRLEKLERLVEELL